MNQKTKKFMDFEARSVSGEDRTYWFTASTPARDRMGDIIIQEGWRTNDFLKTGGPILWGHDYYSTPIGNGKEVRVSPDNLDIKVQFIPEGIDPLADRVERLVKGGHIRTGSVGFSVYKREPLNADDLKQRPEMKYGQRLYGDLLEFSIVPVPANPEALSQKDFVEAMAKGFGFVQGEARSKYLPYVDAKGNFSPALLRASVAASWGARGGVKITDADPVACRHHLYSVAKQNKIEVPSIEEMEKLAGTGAPSTALKEYFKDVWHDELLEVINLNGEELIDVSLKLIKGEKRNELIKARDSLNLILEMSEPEPAKVDSQEMLNLMNDINKNLSGVQALL